MADVGRSRQAGAKVRRGWIAVPALCAGALAGAAAAQDFGGIEQAPQYSRGYNTAVRERLHPEWAPIDIDLGGFTLEPQVAVTASYLSNEKYATTGAQADGVFRIQPALELGSNWSRNGIGLQAYVGQTEYARHGEDDSTEYGVTATGRLDAYNDLTIDLRGGDNHLVLARSDPDVPVDTNAPAYFDRQTGQVTLTKTLPTFQLQAIAAVRNETYDSATPLKGGGVYDFSGRNGTYGSFSGRLSYGISPAVAAFVGALYDIGDRPSYRGLSQNAQGANIAGGVNFDLSRLARGEIALGYLYQSYDTPGVNSDSGFAFRANVQYFPSQLTTVSLTAERDAAPASVAGSPGGISLGGTLTVDHELLRNLIVSAGVQGGQTQYRGFTGDNVAVINSAYASRTDTTYGGSLGATYLMNRLVSWELQYSYADFSSTYALRRSYTNNRLFLTLRLTK